MNIWDFWAQYHDEVIAIFTVFASGGLARYITVRSDIKKANAESSEKEADAAHTISDAAANLVQNYSERLGKLEDLYRDLEARHTAALCTIEKQGIEIKTLRAQIASQSAQIEKLKQENDALRVQISDQTVRTAELKTENEALRQITSTLKGRQK